MRVHLMIIDPRGRVVSVAYLSLIPASKVSRVIDNPNVRWFSVRDLPKLAYDHDDIVDTAVLRLQGKLEYTNIVCNLLPKEFSLTQLQQMYELILRKKFDKRNFRKKILSLRFVKKAGRQKRGEANRPAELYRCSTLKPQTMEIL